MAAFPGVPGYSLLLGPRALLNRLGIFASIDQGVERQAEVVATVWRRNLKKRGTGRLYEAGTSFITTKGTGPRRVIPVARAAGARTSAHRASAPGKPPAGDTGALVAAVATERAGFAKFKVGMGGKIGRIGLALEFGVNVSGSQVGEHPGDITIEPRPHGRLSIRQARNRATEALISASRGNA